MEHCTCGSGCGSGGAAAANPDATAAGMPIADERGAVSRRGVLTGSAAALAALALAACAGTDQTGAEGSTPEGTPTGESSSPAESPSESASESAEPSEGSPPTGEALASTSEFPTGGGKVVTLGSAVVVVTQPADGQFVAFNGKCPHAGCPVAEVTENTIVCTCHGSTFDGSTGERLEGPAPRGLDPVPVTVEGDTVYLA